VSTKGIQRVRACSLHALCSTVKRSMWTSGSKAFFVLVLLAFWRVEVAALKQRTARSEVQLAAEARVSPAAAFAAPRSPPPSSIYGKVYVGVPPQEFLVVFDTASGNVILPARTCESSACLTKRSYDKLLSATAHEVQNATEFEEVSFAVGHGNIAGRSSQDKVCLSPQKICADTMMVAATQMSDDPFSLFPFDGIVGLGMPSLSLSKAHNFLGNLADANQLDKDRFAVWLATEADKEDSEISFGSLPTARLGSEIVWLPLSSTTSGLWQVKMDDLTLNLIRQDVCPQGCHAAFDTGASVISGPKRIIDAITQELHVDTECNNWDDLPALGFELGGTTFNLDKYDYVKRTNEGCFLQLESLDADVGENTLFLGAPFLTRYVTVYDRVFLRMGLAFAVHSSEPTSESTEDAAKRLMGRQSLGRPEGSKR